MRAMMAVFKGHMVRRQCGHLKAKEDMDEIILCLPGGRVAGSGIGRGYHPMNATRMASMFMDEWVTLAPRSKIETDERVVQLVGYAILRCGRDILVYRRTPGSGEERLRGRLSCGFGGHVSADDIDVENGTGRWLRSTMRATRREVEEELGLSTSDMLLSPSGLIWDDSTAVGRVHLGIVFISDLATMRIPDRVEATIGELRFSPIEQLYDSWSELETWSQLVLDGLRGRAGP
jgi:predicted NUDIX family phosphoesterase